LVVVGAMLKESPPHSVEQKVESQMSMPCAATGSPQPTVQWYRNAVRINNTDRSVQDNVFICATVHQTSFPRVGPGHASFPPVQLLPHLLPFLLFPFFY